VLACPGAVIFAGERQVVGDFSSKSLAGWTSESLAGETDYRFVQVDGRTALRARCNASASGLVLPQEVNLTKTPSLHCSWRVEDVYPSLNEKMQAGEDYPARVYVIHDGGLLKWRSRAVDYVWSSSQPFGAKWQNAFVSQAMMVAVR
jgi:hypothetical protein